MKISWFPETWGDIILKGGYHTNGSQTDACLYSVDKDGQPKGSFPRFFRFVDGGGHAELKQEFSGGLEAGFTPDPADPNFARVDR